MQPRNEAKSLAWRCETCGRIHLALEPQQSPERCLDCDGVRFVSIAPSSDARRAYRETAESIPPPQAPEQRSRRRKRAERR